MLVIAVLEIDVEVDAGNDWYVDEISVVSVVITLVDSALDEALVVFSHLLLYKGVQIASTHINLYIRLLPGFQMPRIFYSKSPSTVNNRGSVSRSVRSCSASCSPIRCDRRKQMTSAPTKIISPETQAQWSERPDHWRFKSEIIARSASWESVTTTLPGPG